MRNIGAAHKNQKRHKVLKYAVFSKGEKPVSLSNLQPLLAYEDKHKAQILFSAFNLSEA